MMTVDAVGGVGDEADVVRRRDEAQRVGRREHAEVGRVVTKALVREARHSVGALPREAQGAGAAALERDVARRREVDVRDPACRVDVRPRGRRGVGGNHAKAAAVRRLEERRVAVVGEDAPHPRAVGRLLLDGAVLVPTEPGRRAVERLGDATSERVVEVLRAQAVAADRDRQPIGAVVAVLPGAARIGIATRGQPSQRVPRDRRRFGGEGTTGAAARADRRALVRGGHSLRRVDQPLVDAETLGGRRPTEPVELVGARAAVQIVHLGERPGRGPLVGSLAHRLVVVLHAHAKRQPVVAAIRRHRLRRAGSFAHDLAPAAVVEKTKDLGAELQGRRRARERARDRHVPPARVALRDDAPAGVVDAIDDEAPAVLALLLVDDASRRVARHRRRRHVDAGVVLRPGEPSGGVVVEGRVAGRSAVAGEHAIGVVVTEHDGGRIGANAPHDAVSGVVRVRARVAREGRLRGQVTAPVVSPGMARARGVLEPRHAQERVVAEPPRDAPMVPIAHRASADVRAHDDDAAQRFAHAAGSGA
jgi:hypothetical protein